MQKQKYQQIKQNKVKAQNSYFKQRKENNSNNNNNSTRQHNQSIHTSNRKKINRHKLYNTNK